MMDSTTISAVEQIMAAAAADNEVVYFDIDGTIVDSEVDKGRRDCANIAQYPLTSIGEWLVRKKIPVTLLTIKGFSKEDLESRGLVVESLIGPVDGIMAGLIDPDTCTKKCKYLVDNEHHPLVEHQMMVKV